MGWRVSWYKADKENPLLLKQEEDYLDIIINGEIGEGLAIDINTLNQTDKIWK